jgi:hypothetical protein
MNHQFQLGDRVEALKDIDNKIKKGWQGTILSSPTNFPFNSLIGIEWDLLKSGHELSNNLPRPCQPRQGWNVYSSDIIKISSNITLKGKRYLTIDQEF